MVRTKHSISRGGGRPAVPVELTPEERANKAVLDTAQYDYYVSAMNGLITADFETYMSLQDVLEAILNPLEEPSSMPTSMEEDGPTIDVSIAEVVEAHVRDDLGEAYMASAIVLVLADATLSVAEKANFANRSRRIVVVGSSGYYAPFTFTSHYDGLLTAVLRMLTQSDEALQAADEDGSAALTVESAMPAISQWLAALGRTLPALLTTRPCPPQESEVQNYDYQNILAYERYLRTGAPVVLRPVPAFRYDRGAYAACVTQFQYVCHLLALTHGSQGQGVGATGQGTGSGTGTEASAGAGAGDSAGSAGATV